MIDNELVDQKNAIYKLILNEEYEKAMDLLVFSRKLWEANTYGYKYTELVNIIKRDISTLKCTCGHWKSEEKYQRLLNRAYSLE